MVGHEREKSLRDQPSHKKVSTSSRKHRRRNTNTGVLSGQQRQPVTSIDKKENEANVLIFRLRKILGKGEAVPPSWSQLVPHSVISKSNEFVLPFYSIQYQQTEIVPPLISNNLVTLACQLKQNKSSLVRNWDMKVVHVEAKHLKHILDPLTLPHIKFWSFSAHLGDGVDIGKKICVAVEVGGSGKLNGEGANATILFEKQALDEFKQEYSVSDDVEAIKCCLEEQMNDTVNLSMCGYLGDSEETVEDQAADFARNRQYRKKFGVYLQYKIRFNGVPWKFCCDNSDDEGNTGQTGQVDYRGSRKLKEASKGRKNKKLMKRGSSPSCNENDEESEPLMVHVVSTKRRKKRKLCDPDFNSTTSGASDVESLTDCSLCYID